VSDLLGTASVLRPGQPLKYVLEHHGMAMGHASEVDRELEAEGSIHGADNQSNFHVAPY
jgi:hypothetical protein